MVSFGLESNSEYNEIETNLYAPEYGYCSVLDE